MTPFEAFRQFHAIKSHFTIDKYDYFKYNGKMKNTTVDAFEKRHDKYQYHKLSKHRDVVGYVLSNIVKQPDLWVGNLFDEEHEANYTDWLKRTQSLTYNFTNELSLLQDDFSANFKVIDGHHPYLYKLYRSGQLSIETLCILNNMLGFVESWDKSISDTLVWPIDSKTIKKYTPFISLKNKEKTVISVVKKRFMLDK